MAGALKLKFRAALELPALGISIILEAAIRGEPEMHLSQIKGREAAMMQGHDTLWWVGRHVVRPAHDVYRSVGRNRTDCMNGPCGQ